VGGKVGTGVNVAVGLGVFVGGSSVGVDVGVQVGTPGVGVSVDVGKAATVAGTGGGKKLKTLRATRQ